ncbi:17314_t:CDS:2 [Entrophospora sp. SA101]|nr:17314_t:CDS:2 [Entrophospora sp. SA101]
MNEFKTLKQFSLQKPLTRVHPRDNFASQGAYDDFRRFMDHNLTLSTNRGTLLVRNITVNDIVPESWENICSAFSTSRKVFGRNVYHYEEFASDSVTLNDQHANCQKDKEQLAQQIKDHQTSQVEKEKLNQQITQLQQDKQDLQQQLVEAMAELTGAHQLEGELEAKIVQTSPFTEGGNK